MLVRIPMMPKGVEHPPLRFFRLHRAKVRIPMMPKGVEHTSNWFSGLVANHCENSDVLKVVPPSSE